MNNAQIPPKVVSIPGLKRAPEKKPASAEAPITPVKQEHTGVEHVKKKTVPMKRTPSLPQAPDLANETSLPVLQAFQDFIDTERKNAKKQASLMAAAFFLTILVVAAGGILASMFYTSRINTQIGILRDELSKIQKESLSVTTDTASLLSDISKKTSLLESSLSSGESVIESVKLEMNETLEKQKDEIGSVSKLITLLQDENDRLKNSLQEMRDTFASRPTADPAAQPSVAPSTTVQDARLVAFMIQPDGYTNAFPWRITTGE